MTAYLSLKCLGKLHKWSQGDWLRIGIDGLNNKLDIEVVVSSSRFRGWQGRQYNSPMSDAIKLRPFL
jgi:hypothetical protein